MVRLFASATPPTVSDDASALTVGLEFQVSESSAAASILFFQPSSGTVSAAERTVAIYEVVGPFEGTAVYTGALTPAGAGWQSHPVSGTVLLDPAKRYRVAVFHPAGGYVATSAYFSTGDGATGVTSGALSAPNSADATGTTQGSYRAGSPIGFPASEFNSANYWVDIEIAGAPAAVVRFVAHNGTAWVQAQGWAHDGLTWVPAAPAGL